jgi:hypothetical protein
MKVSDLMGLSLEERISHIDLSEPCTPLGYTLPKAKTCADFGVENDLGNWREAGVHRCHICNANSKNGWCSNPRHYFLGTPKENAIVQRALLQLISNDWYEPATLRGTRRGTPNSETSLARYSKEFDSTIAEVQKIFLANGTKVTKCDVLGMALYVMRTTVLDYA